MSSLTKVTAVALVVLVAQEAMTRLKTRKKESAKIASEMAAIALAEKRMLERINSGKYDQNFNTLMDDIHFEFIAAHYE